MRQPRASAKRASAELRAASDDDDGASPKGKAAAAAPTAKPAAATCDVCFGEGALVRCSTCAYAVHAARGNIQPEYAALFDDDWR